MAKNYLNGRRCFLDNGRGHVGNMTKGVEDELVLFLNGEHQRRNGGKVGSLRLVYGDLDISKAFNGNKKER